MSILKKLFFFFRLFLDYRLKIERKIKFLLIKTKVLRYSNNNQSIFRTLGTVCALIFIEKAPSIREN